MLRPSLLLLFSAGCIGGDPGSLASNDAEANAPAVALGASGELLDYGETDGSCFRVPGVARGTGFAQHPELALGVVWTMEAECDDCMWGASSDLYLGAGLSKVRQSRANSRPGICRRLSRVRYAERTKRRAD